METLRFGSRPRGRGECEVSFMTKVRLVTIALLTFISCALCLPCGSNDQGRRGQELLRALTNREYVKLQNLLKAGASPNNPTPDGLTPMALAVATSDLRALQILFRYGGDLTTKATKEGHSLVYWACLKESNDSVLRFILKKWPAKTSKVADLNPSLLKAAFAGREGMVNILLSNGADANCEDRRGVSPLQITTSSKVAHTLLRRGSKINHESVDGQTALHAAAYDGNYDLVTLLLSSGAQVSKTDMDGNNPLHYLVEGYRSPNYRKYLKICRLLIKEGVSVQAKNKSGYTPERLAIVQGKTKLAHELRQKG